MTVAFSNSGNRDAALLRAEPALWHDRKGTSAGWVPLAEKVSADIPITAPATPPVIKAGGVEVVKIAATLAPADAESAIFDGGGDHPSDPERVRRLARGSAGRPPPGQQEDAVRVGRRTLLASRGPPGSARSHLLA